MTLWIKHARWVRLFWCMCGRIHWFRKTDYTPAVDNAFIARDRYDRAGEPTRVPARYAKVCPCGMGHYKTVER